MNTSKTLHGNVKSPSWMLRSLMGMAALSFHLFIVYQNSQGSLVVLWRHCVLLGPAVLRLLMTSASECKRVRATVIVLPTIVWDSNQESVNMLPLPLAVFQVRNFLVCGIRQTPMQRFHKFEPLPQQGRECKAPKFQFLWMPGTCENWSSLAYGTTFYPTSEKILGNFPGVCHQWIKHKEK
jgi:hypothetical protein